MASRGDSAESGTLRPAVLPVLVVLALLLPHPSLTAQEFGASTPPEGGFLLMAYPKAFFASDRFSDEGKALNLEEVTGLFYVELPVQVQYGVTGSLAVGAIVPFGWTYQEVEPEIRKEPVHHFAVREVWLMVQHQWWTLPFISSSSLRVKIPLMDKEEWEDGLRIGDGQVDLYPAYFFDYYSVDRYWFVELELGYKYRFRNGDIKPFDELNFRSVAGFEFLDDKKLEGFIFADLTRFRNGDYGETDRAFFEKDGSLHTLGYGVSYLPSPDFQIYVETAGDLSGRNRYRGMYWTVGLRKVFGSGG